MFILYSKFLFLNVSFLQLSVLKLRDLKDRKFMGTTRSAYRCLILRVNGELSQLDLGDGWERELTDSVELFWVTCGLSEEKTNLIEKVWYPSPGVDPFKQEVFLQLDPELEFDCERDKSEEALRSVLSAKKPHFPHCLEWLLFTVFDAEISKQSANKSQISLPARAAKFSLLEKTCGLIRRFPEYFDAITQFISDYTQPGQVNLVEQERFPLEEVFEQLRTFRGGLSSEDVEVRLQIFSPNNLEEKTENKILKFLSFMWNPLSWAMEAAAVMAIVLANGGGQGLDWQDFIRIVCLLLINSTICFIEENNPGNAAASLMAHLPPKPKSALTGESLPVTKRTGDEVFLVRRVSTERLKL
ncbi:hypothetical protein RHMOL_Rhmol06G0178000 [Rhododendron molle]|uniref:Uncharacterized protein n=5 Tax=Rhododendron molle TaxID=49168 RepID=A0ACC0NDK3_RHOML|nr:hypothetical protein RHMOL_Rhmol06G0178000 [Rhododendron molle]KAI8551330.1 hypothetical protein RHMOL_Rhmol06G0178000 [Rhododendron molle]KAI8551331.1 hypothetical protein RHMOL_Rhmol06G0178000 [Rhododendron molle]KAI8551332.1 hypothetical protein RHMOL_Rhmol06G0178000 [Rhododendron molle]KAI8551333.1 hypothetical protein RHMOL_Rhmol06G0178000 [Rhododendron molle]